MPALIAAPLVLALAGQAPMDVGGASERRAGPQPLRYRVDAVPGDMGVPQSVALGDDGALLVVGRSAIDGGIDFYSTADASPIRELRFDQDARMVAVAAAEHAPVAAAFALIDVDPDPNVYLHEPQIRIYDAKGEVLERWTWEFPREFSWYLFGGGVAVSDDGSIVIGWFDSADRRVVHVVAFDARGAILSESEIPMRSSGGFAGGVRLDATGTRAVLATSTDAIVLEVGTGAILARHTVASGDHLNGIAISADGRRFAAADDSELVVYEELASGLFDSVLRLTAPVGEKFGRVDLSADGSRLGYTEREYWPGFDLVLLEIDSRTELVRKTFEEEGLSYPLIDGDVELDGAGRIIACASFGDTEHSTPEATVHDDSGRQLSRHRLSGSALDVDLDDRGDLVAFGGTPDWGIHSRGGQFVLADTARPSLRAMGAPIEGGALEVTFAGEPSHTRAFLWGATDVRTSGSVLAPVLTGPRVFRLVATPLEDGVAEVVLPIEGTASLSGRLLHLQGFLRSRDSGLVTNKVSLRVR